jgi:hypothetical protein
LPGDLAQDLGEQDARTSPFGALASSAVDGRKFEEITAGREAAAA